MNSAQQQNNLGTVIDLSKFARVSLGHQPTPIESMKLLEAELGGPNLRIERDDFTGLAIGGNKNPQTGILGRHCSKYQHAA